MTDSRQLRDSPERWWLVALLVVGMVFCYAQRGALSIAAPSMMKELGLSRAVMGILLSAFSWSYSFLQMPAGWLVDRFGVRRAYAYGFAAWSVASSLTGYARNLAALIVARVVLGVGQAVAFPASARAVSNWFHDRERGTVAASYLTGVRLGQGLISAIGGFFLASYGFKSFFLLTGLIPLVWILPWNGFLKHWERSEPEVKAAHAGGDRRSLTFVESLGLFRQQTVLGIFLGFFAYDYAWFVYTNWLPGYLSHERKFGLQEVGIYSSFPYLAMAVIIILSGVAGDWLIRRGRSENGVRKVMIVIGLALGCLIVPAGFVEDRMASVWLITISMCGLGVATPNTWTLTQAVCSKKIVGTVSGIQNFGGNVGGILSPLLTGIIAERTGSYAMSFVLSGAILVAGMAAYAFLIRRDVEA